MPWPSRLRNWAKRLVSSYVNVDKTKQVLHDLDDPCCFEAIEATQYPLQLRRTVSRTNILFEHKSRPAHWTLTQLLRYIVAAGERHR